MAFAILITEWRRLNCCFLLLYDELCFTPFDIKERGFFAVNNTEKRVSDGHKANSLHCRLIKYTPGSPKFPFHLSLNLE